MRSSRPPTTFICAFRNCYCGFPRIEGQGPAPYPVACLPQAVVVRLGVHVAAGVPGLSVDGHLKAVHIERPMLPPGIEALDISNLAVGKGRIDLQFRRVGHGVVAVPMPHQDESVRILARL